MLTGLSSQQTPMSVRIEKRQFALAIDAPVNTPITRVFIVDGVARKDNLDVKVVRVSNILGPFHDAHDYFDLFPLKNSGKNVQYELFLKKPLLKNFKVFDQIVFAIAADDGLYTIKNEMYGKIEEARNPSLSTVAIQSTFPPTSPAPSTTTSTSTTASTLVPTRNVTEAAEQEVTFNAWYLCLLAFIFPIGGCCMFRKKIQNKFRKWNGKKDLTLNESRGSDNVVSGTISNSTEFSVLPSRKTSYASTFWSNPYEDTLLQTKDISDDKDKWEFPRHHLKFYGILGEGCFGQVWKCEALNIDGRKGTTMVAVKTLKESASNKEKDDLLDELKLMKMLLNEPHPNVVRLLGCCTSSSDKDPTYVIMEYVAKGKLQEFLRKSRADHYYGNLHGSSQKLTSRDLTSFCYQVAKGIEYLSSRKVIHRDLAARNILVSETNVCKVADFGFSRDVMANNIYERKSDGRLPIRWMAPEALYDNIYTAKTDVWSFGVLMWEIATLGSTPYPGMSGSEVMKKVKEGFRLDKPEHCDREIYNMMFYCWDKDPDERPSFSALVKDLEKLLTQGTDYIDLNLFPEHGYYNDVSLSGERV